MRASVHIDLPGWTKLGPKVLAARCEELHLQPRGTRGESGGQTGELYIAIFGSLLTSPLFRRHLRHLQQAPAGLLGGGARPEDDRRGQHALQGGQGSEPGSWHLVLDRQIILM